MSAPYVGNGISDTFIKRNNYGNTNKERLGFH